MSKHRSVIVYNVIQIFPAVGWGAVYEDEDGTERRDTIDFLGLAQTVEKVFLGDQEIDTYTHPNEIVGVDIDADGCFGVCNECSNFIRLCKL